MMRVPGIHHVTAIARDPQKNVDFYCGVLGLRLVKQTVNFDDPSTYHLYYGDSQGSPGTILTFFPWHSVPEGRRGTGQPVAVAFEVGKGGLASWQNRLNAIGVDVVGPLDRFNEKLIAFNDPDQLRLEIVESGSGTEDITGLHSVTLSESGYETTAHLLTTTLGLEQTQTENNRYRYSAVDSAAPGRFVDILCQPDSRRGSLGTGTIHHVAFRARNDEEQIEWRALLARAGQNVTPVLDRQYFHSIYFREPGGVLFEIATDPPGFSVDESLESLGHSLQLPPSLEPQRREIQALLGTLKLPETGRRLRSHSQSPK